MALCFGLTEFPSRDADEPVSPSASETGVLLNGQADAFEQPFFLHELLCGFVRSSVHIIELQLVLVARCDFLPPPTSQCQS